MFRFLLPAMFQNILLDILKRWLGTPQAPANIAPLFANMPSAWLSQAQPD